MHIGRKHKLGDITHTHTNTHTHRQTNAVLSKFIISPSTICIFWFRSDTTLPLLWTSIVDQISWAMAILFGNLYLKWRKAKVLLYLSQPNSTSHSTWELPGKKVQQSHLIKIYADTFRLLMIFLFSMQHHYDPNLCFENDPNWSRIS